LRSILQINTTVNSGSTGRIAENIGEMAINNNWDSYIAFGRNKRKSTSKLIRIGNDLDLYYHGIKTRLFDRHGFGSVISTKRFIQKVNQIKPSIIHLHNLHGYYLNVQILFDFLRKVNIPVIWTLHDCWPITGHCTHFDNIRCEKWKHECFNCPQKGEYPKSLFIDRSKENFNLKKDLFTSDIKLTIVAVSNWLEGIIKQSFLSKFPVKVIHNGIDINQFKPVKDIGIDKKYSHLSKNFTILGVANKWSPRKGLNDFLELSKKIDEDINLILVGLDKKQISLLPKKIIGYERTENLQDLVQVYSLADIFINPSVEETFGLTVAEAFACGTPAIVYNSTGSPEIINKDVGFTVEAGDIDGILKAIEIVRKNGKQNYSEHCVRHISENFNNSKQINEYLNLYNSVLEQ